MMRPSSDLPVVYFCREAVDFRKGLKALAVLVESQLKLDPFSAQLFAFRNRRAMAVKVLHWERNGFCLWQKRLEKERFHWPRTSQEAVVTINGAGAQLALGRLRYRAHETASNPSFCIGFIVLCVIWHGTMIHVVRGPRTPF
jgi:transposase